MKRTQAPRGFCTINFWAADTVAAVRWYTELLGIDPYFVRPEQGHPEYIEFRFGDYRHEFGILDVKHRPKGAHPGPGGAVVYWHFDDIEAALERVKAMGAVEHEPLIDREAGFRTASVVDPFGNIFGLMYNPHYLEVLAGKKPA